MMHVAKPFKTVNRRFAIGTVVQENDDLSPHTLADLKDRGFIATPGSASEPSRASARPRGSNQTE
jgi:hypothetical protein